MSNGAYLSFATRNRGFLGFGFLLTLASSFGQTYFIGVFGPGIQASFDLSHTAWGTIYMLGTLASALLFVWTGKLIDRVDLRAYTAAVCLALIAACVCMALVTGPVTLALAVFLLRQSGQGLCSHIAITSMARYFEAGRGRAIALASLGFAAGQAVLPWLAVLAVDAVGWRWTYAGIAVLLGVGLMPAALRLLEGHAQRHRDYLERRSWHGRNGGRSTPAWTRGQVLRDRRFALLLPGMLAPAFILTALFFHHLNLAEAKGWSGAWITGNYAIYAFAAVLASLTAGRLVDRYGASRFLPFMLLPLVAGMALVGALSDAWIVWPYLFLIGINTGLSVTVAPALWAELYGVEHLGAIKSMTTALGVFATALGPIGMGGLMDLGLSMEAICLLFAGYAAGGALLIVMALRVFGSQKTD